MVKQRTMLINAVRGHCSELGMTASQGASRVNDLLVLIEDPDDPRLPTFAGEALGVLIAQLQAVKKAIRTRERKLQTWHRSQHANQRLTTIPGVGVMTATALVATIGDGSQFTSGRHLSAWLGLVPRKHSSWWKKSAGSYLQTRRRVCQASVGSRVPSCAGLAVGGPQRPSPWMKELLARRPTNVVLVAMANKTAPTVWAMMRDQQHFNPVFR